MPKYKIDELNSLHQDAKSVDKEVHAEMRSNILLVAGEHYSKRMTEWWNRSRTTQSVGENNKLRITKNWLHKAHRLYVTHIMGQSPGTTVSPKNPMELQDQKDAELNKAVWEHIKQQVKFRSCVRDWASDYCGIGEACVKVFWDPTKGYLKGYEPMVDEMTGEPFVDEMGQPVPDESKPVMSGEFVFERVYGQNMFRDPTARQMKDSRWIGIEKVESFEAMLRRYEGDPDKKKMIVESKEEYVVFDSNRNGYSKESNTTIIREFYFKPSTEYKNGYYYITTKAGILEEGELPGGIFPISWVGFDEHPTRARASSPIKVGRPWQAEINRASSQVAMHQITISEDKILYQAGADVTQGALLPGVRGIKYRGAPPTILPGRSGDQYFEYIDKQVMEMDRALMIDLLDSEKASNLDPFSLLFRSMSQGQKFSFYAEKFGEFLVDVTKITLELAKFYLPDDEVIAAVGRSEVINLAEFRKTTPLCHRIHVEEQNETIETRLGKQLVLNHILQYVGQNLKREDIGKLIVNMPFGNWEESFKEFTLDERNVKNDFLAIERGEMPQMSEADNSDYILKQIAARKKERDFALLSPIVQDLYAQYEAMHLQKKAAEASALKAAQSEYIPTGGAMIACDMYLPSDNPEKAPKRARVPYQALDWLLKMLEQQGMGMEKLEAMNQGQLAELSQMLLGQGIQVAPQGLPVAG